MSCRQTRFALPLFVLVASSCAADLELEVDTDDVDATDESKADASGEVRVRAGETSLWVDRVLTPRVQDGRSEWVLSGHTSRTLTDGTSFIFDDVVGNFATAGARSFEVAYPAGDRGLMTGVAHFVRMQFQPSSSRPTTLTARVIARPRLLSYSGKGAYLTAELVPVEVGGRVVWRLSGNASSAIDGVSARVGDLVLGAGDVRVVDPTHFTVDLLDDHVTALVGGQELVLDLDLSSGTWQKRARLGIALKRLGLTSGDPLDVWPPPQCEDEVSECLGDLPDGTSDTSPCGEALEVLQCGGVGSGGVVFDDVRFGAASDQADALLEGTFATDAPALAGADRAAELAFAVKQEIEGGLEQMIGQSFGGPAALDAAVAAVMTAAIDHAYARPLDLALPHAAAPGSIAKTRQVVADALLAHLADLDLTQTEFGRPLEELTRQFRQRHVDDLRAFRTQVTPEQDSQGRDVYVHNWLDPHVEVTVVPSTGEVVNVLFEID
jgi:hypothetical protein